MCYNFFMEKNLALLSIAPQDFDEWRSQPQLGGYASNPMPKTDPTLFHQIYQDKYVNTDYATVKWCGRKIYYLLAIPFKVVEIVIRVAGAVFLLLAAVVSRLLNGDWQIAHLAGRQFLFSIVNLFQILGYLGSIIFDEKGMLFLEERKLWMEIYNLKVDEIAKRYFSNEKIFALSINHQSRYDNSDHLAAFIEGRFNETKGNFSSYLSFRSSLKKIIDSSNSVIEIFKLIPLIQSADFREVLFTMSFEHLIKKILPQLKEKKDLKSTLDEFSKIWVLICKMDINFRTTYLKECLKCMKNFVNINDKKEIEDYLLYCSFLISKYCNHDDKDDCSDTRVGHFIEFLSSPESAIYGNSQLFDHYFTRASSPSQLMRMIVCGLNLIKTKTSPLYKNSYCLEFSLYRQIKHQSQLLPNFIANLVYSTDSEENPEKEYCDFIYEFFSKHKKLCQAYMIEWDEKLELYERNKEIYDPNNDKEQLEVLDKKINKINLKYGKFITKVIKKNPRILNVYLNHYFDDFSTKYCIELVKKSEDSVFSKVLVPLWKKSDEKTRIDLEMFAYNFFESFNNRIVDYLWNEKAETTCSDIIEKACTHEKDEQFLAMFKSLQELYIKNTEESKNVIGFLEYRWFQPLLRCINFARPLLEKNKWMAPYLCLSKQKGKIVKVSLIKDSKEESQIEFARVVETMSWKSEIYFPLLSQRYKIGGFANFPRYVVLKIITYIFENNSRWGKRLGANNIGFPAKQNSEN